MKNHLLEQQRQLGMHKNINLKKIISNASALFKSIVYYFRI
jgi:hypothetical protein